MHLQRLSGVKLGDQLLHLGILTTAAHELSWPGRPTMLRATHSVPSPCTLALQLVLEGLCNLWIIQGRSLGIAPDLEALLQQTTKCTRISFAELFRLHGEEPRGSPGKQHKGLRKLDAPAKISKHYRSASLNSHAEAGSDVPDLSQLGGHAWNKVS